jgi:hypothetical protein
MHPFGGKANIAEQARQFTGCLREIAHLLDGKLIEGLNLSVDRHKTISGLR